MRKLSYAEAGVDIHLENRSIDAMKSVLTSRRKGFGAPMTEIGHYAGLLDMGSFGLRTQLLTGTLEGFIGIHVAELVPSHDFPPGGRLLEASQRLVHGLHQLMRITMKGECAPTSHGFSVYHGVRKIGGSFDTTVLGGQLMNRGAGGGVRTCTAGSDGGNGVRIA